ncbi:DUF4396 domain-containing protein [Spectribacter hydrogenoxidans]|uniref:DUF4396 domain-containing protein n=1 Tax=Spectribacter hydrogenoxidans TaxID=3075608 RepID=A0ABU3BZ27_9GAMM|nr:DUF4396 domain-containing protein [Salinisphaera sp. W335]MDT0634562.1 DUF4396 domain-containing protein [Salinisphaera sp. W335]
MNNTATDQTCEHGGHTSGLFKSSAHVTLHCLTGCGIGELLGLVIGTLAGWGAFATMSLAVVLAFVVGISLAAVTVMRNHGLALGAALATVWLGEVASISVMEIAMNGIDYAVGGVQAGSLAAPIFWIGFGLALPCGYLAAWPVNYWLLTRNLKHCH